MKIKSKFNYKSEILKCWLKNNPTKLNQTTDYFRQL